MTVGVIGHGVIGSAIAKALRLREFETIIFDPYKLDIHQGMKILDANALFICVPTPTENGKQNISALIATLSFLASESYRGTVIIKSTILPGTTKAMQDAYPTLHLCHNPEFLTAKTPYEDFLAQPAVIVSGGLADLTIVSRLYEKLLPRTQVVTARDTATTEIAKYFHNVFLATKVGFCNEIYKICEKMHVSYQEVLTHTLSQGKIGITHTQVPNLEVVGGKQLFGFGGFCFPKDLQALLSWADKVGVELEQMNATNEANLKLRPEWKCS